MSILYIISNQLAQLTNQQAIKQEAKKNSAKQASEG